MAEHIEREAVRCKNCIHNVVCIFRNDINDIDEWIDAFGCGDYKPAADVVEVRHGVWELHGNDDDIGCSYFCSKCGANYDEDWFYEHGYFIQFNYCPNCGAKMDGKGEGEC